MERLLENADERVVSFEIGDIFNDNSINFEEINTSEVTDSELSEIILDGNLLLQQNAMPSDTGNKDQNKAENSDKITPNSTTPKQNRFKIVSNEEVDTIAGKTCKKAMHKQTDWGVKVLRGTDNFLCFDLF